MDQKEDEEKIVEKLRVSGKKEDLQLARNAELAMRKIRQVPLEDMVLEETRDLKEVYNKTRHIYSQAYSWDPPSDYESNNTWRIRQHIKRWINSWDLVRLYPEYQPDIQVSQLTQSYSEDLDLEDTDDESGDSEDWNN
jgi:hypothetical protein